MKINSRATALPLTDPQRFFATCWYNMVHEFSLDSYRVRAMNSRNIVRELLKMTSPPADHLDLEMVAKEALQVLNDDPLMHVAAYKIPAEELMQLLNVDKKAEAKEKPLDGRKTMLRVFAMELLDLLDRSYVVSILDRLEELLITQENVPPLQTEHHRQIHILTGNLLSSLLDTGASVESLFLLYREVLARNKAGKTYKFASRYSLLRKLVTKPPSNFVVVFAIENTTNPREFPASIGNVSFSVTPPEVKDSKPDVARYATGNPSRIFATVQINTQDHRTAGTRAYSAINAVLDLVRFEYERRPAQIQQDFIIAEEGSPDKFRIFPIPRVVPNPSVAVNSTELTAFVQSVNELRGNSTFTEEGRDRIQSAFRLYRVGADTNIFENKLTNWWTAIEYLVKGSNGSGNIGKGVEDALIPVLCLSYIRKLLLSFRNTLVDLKAKIIDPVTGIEVQLQALSSVELYETFKRNDMRAPFLGAATDPFLHYKLEIFLDRLANPNGVLDLLHRHEQRLRWHVQRLYRTRCDIVHSAERTVNAALLCANLEFYLKSTLTALLRTVGAVRTLTGPKEFFDRQSYQYVRLKDALAQGRGERILASL